MTAPQIPPPGLKGKILVIDDELDIREGLYDLLTLEGGYTVELAHNGTAGPHFLADIEKDVLLPLVRAFVVLQDGARLSPRVGQSHKFQRIPEARADFIGNAQLRLVRRHSASAAFSAASASSRFMRSRAALRRCTISMAPPSGPLISVLFEYFFGLKPRSSVIMTPSE